MEFRNPSRGRVAAPTVRMLGISVVLVLALISATSPAEAQDDPPVDPDVENLGDGIIDGAVRYGEERRSIGSSDVPCTWDVMGYLRYLDYWAGFVGSPNAEDPPDPEGQIPRATSTRTGS